jgi:DNA-binding Xre family transcriptional regulator
VGLRWKVTELLSAHAITPYRLMKESGVGQGTAYRLAANQAQTVNLETLDAIIRTLRKLTGEAVGVEDLLVFEED